ncbi:MAG TPA: TIGR02556 family CRISPR-associated protein [Paenibacillaceae bacterium]|nr:TIGR02556 family CRISPR-associated protein [Paenibacillaceae bacterium]
MITAVRDIGRYSQDQNGNSNPLSTLLTPITLRNYKYALVVEFNTIGDGFQYQEVHLEELSEGTLDKFLYRKGGPNGPNDSPSALITEVEKTLPVKFFGWFKALVKKEKHLPDNIKDFVRKMNVALTNSSEHILQDLMNHDKAIFKEGVLLSLSIDGNYPAEIEEIKTLFFQTVTEKENKISSKQQVCSVCGERKEMVSAGSPAFRFYTIDKPGFISGHFNEELSWRNFPVCSDCNLELQEGKKVIEKQLYYNFYGLSYLLIPKFFLPESDAAKEVLFKLMEKLDSKVSLKGKDVVNNYLTNEEDDLAWLSEENDLVMLNFLFMKKVQSAERILLLIEDVLPSRLSTIFKAKVQVEKAFHTEGSGFDFGRIRTFFAKSDEGKRDNDLDKYFLEIVNKVFKDVRISIDFLMRYFMFAIRRAFLRDEHFRGKAYDALMDLLFFDELNLLNPIKEGENMESKFDEVFQRYSRRMDTPEKKGIFLLGALTQAFLDLQYATRKSTPFREQLAGLRLNERGIIGLTSKLMQKFTEYKALDKEKQLVFSEVNSLILGSDSKWTLSIDELNFYFVAGMTLRNEIIPKREKDNQVNSKEEINNESL